MLCFVFIYDVFVFDLIGYGDEFCCCWVLVWGWVWVGSFGKCGGAKRVKDES